MNAGLFKERIDIYRGESISDQYGSDSTEYIFKHSTKARVLITKQDREIINYSEEYPTIVTFCVRLYNDIRHTDRIMYCSDNYMILSIYKDKLNGCIEIKGSLIKE